MNLKDLMTQYLREEGFCPKDTEYGIDFKFEGTSYAFLYEDDDEQFFRLLMPNIFEMTEENEDVVLRAMNEANASVKVVKIYTPVEGYVWAGFEVLVDSTPVLGDIVPRALNMLRAGQHAFYEALNKG